MKIRVRFFASLREALGPEQLIECAPGTTVGQIREQFVTRGGAYAIALGPERAVRCAWNQDLCELERIVDSDGELAFFPPVTGG